ncbi:sugar phosphate isomerase/epimerase [Ruminococcaceae bacterium OttesenSCG-928-I18]|nr:sugar phosphate isomerase/epimerase [Ruminococcaceae bacterium OttesenSCG-928-I18]
MKLAASHIAWNAGQDEQAFSLLREYGFSGLEIAPTRVAGPMPYERLAEAAVFAGRMADGYGLRVCSMQSIWYGQLGSLFGAEREELLEYTKAAIRFARAAGIPNLVFGCPKNRILPKGGREEEAVGFFRQVGEYAAEQGTCFALEANPALYGTNFMNHTADALAMARRVDSRGCKVNLDFGAIVANGEDLGALQGRIGEINHVHISEPNLVAIEERPEHRYLAEMLREEKYEGYVSLEMREQPLEVVKKSLAWLAEVFA